MGIKSITSHTVSLSLSHSRDTRHNTSSSHDHPIPILILHHLPPLLPPTSKRPHRRSVFRTLAPELAVILMTYIHRGEEGHEDGQLQGCTCESTAWLRDSMSARVTRATESSEKQKTLWLTGLKCRSPDEKLGREAAGVEALEEPGWHCGGGGAR